MNKHAGWWLVLGFLVVAGWSATSPDEKERKPRFTVSKETTYVTGPRDKDGLINYEAALNKRLGEAVKPADNANVLLWKAFGPHPEKATKMPAEYFALQGVQAPPEEGEYFSDLFQYLKEHLKGERPLGDDAIHDLIDRAAQRPWTAKELPHIAAWLKANEKPLTLVVEATKRPHYFSPLVSRRTKQGPSGLLGALLPGVQKCRDLARALTIRAMLRVGQGRYDEAWQDLLSCHRLGRLVAKGATAVEELVGIAIDTFGSGADLAFLEGCRLDAKQFKSCLRDLQKLPPMPAVADKVDFGERLFFLDTVMMINRYGIEYLEGTSEGKLPKALGPQAMAVLANVDWDPALRNANRWYDRLAAAMRLNDRADREKQLDQVEKDLKELRSSVRASEALAKALCDEETPAAARGKLIGDVLIGILMPAVRKVQQAEERSEQTQRNLHIAFGLAAYHRDQGRYPKGLAALAPAYLAQIPEDLFAGKALIYRPTKGGYLLYSVGVNGRDEQGRSYDDNPPGDDLTVRMPLPKLPR
jgi:hypothetical protein